MSIDFKQLMDEMKAAGCDGGSKFHLREESNQRVVSVPKFQMLRKSLKKKSKLLIILDLAIPFNPETGEADDKFNGEHKYRPPYSATTVALALKDLANQKEVTKQAFIRRAGVQEWDTSNTKELTEADWTIFRKYRMPRVFTVPAININIPAMTKYESGRNYAISIKRNEVGEIDGEIPTVLKVNKLFRDRSYEEIKDYTDQIDRGEIVVTDKQRREHISDIYGKSPVSDELRLNWVELIEIPLTSQYKISSDFDVAGVTPESIAPNVKLTKYGKSLRVIVEEFVCGDLIAFDKHFDFFDIDMVCPIDGDESTSQGKMLIGKDTKFEKPAIKLSDEPACTSIEKAIKEYLDKHSNVEEMAKASIRIAPYTKEVEEQMLKSLESVIDLSDPFFTQEVLTRNTEIVTYIFGDQAADLLADVAAGVSDKEEGSLDEKESVKNATTFGLDSLDDDDFTDGLEE